MEQAGGFLPLLGSQETPLKVLGSKIKFYFNLPLDRMVDAIIYVSEILAAFQKLLSPAILVFMCKT